MKILNERNGDGMDKRNKYLNISQPFLVLTRAYHTKLFTVGIHQKIPLLLPKHIFIFLPLEMVLTSF